MTAVDFVRTLTYSHARRVFAPVVGNIAFAHKAPEMISGEAGGARRRSQRDERLRDRYRRTYLVEHRDQVRVDHGGVHARIHARGLATTGI
jgi:hypothetical protein